MATETTETAVTTTTTASTEPLTTTRQVYDAGRDAALAKVAAIRAEKAQAGQTAAGDSGAPAGQASGEQAGEVIAQTAGQEREQATETVGAIAETTQETATSEPSEEDKAAQTLLAAAKENRALIEQRRRIAQRETELAEREKKLSTAVVPEREMVARLTKARESGDPIEVLRASGYRDEDIANFALGLVERLPTVGAEQEQKQPQRPPTAEEVAELVRQKAEADARAANERAQVERTANMEAQRNQYFAGITSEFKANAKAYPVLSALRPTYAQLETAFVEHFQRTGERLTAPQLLASLEKEYGGRGLTVTPKKPATTTTVGTATSKTVGARATSDAGSVTVRDEVEPKKPKDIHELNEEGRRAAIADIERKRAAKKTARA